MAFLVYIHETDEFVDVEKVKAIEFTPRGWRVKVRGRRGAIHVRSSWSWALIACGLASRVGLTVTPQGIGSAEYAEWTRKSIPETYPAGGPL
jgi:hypothetical protein